MLALKVWQRLSILVGIFSCALILIGGIGLSSAGNTLEGLRHVYEDELQGMLYLSKVDQSLRTNGAQFALALQHDPSNPLSKAHDHLMDVHISKLKEGLREATDNWKSYLDAPHDDEERKQIEEARKAIDQYPNLINSASAYLAEGHFSSDASIALVKESVSVGNNARKAIENLLDLKSARIKRSYEVANSSYQQSRYVMIGIVIGTLLICLLLSRFLV